MTNFLKQYHPHDKYAFDQSLVGSLFGLAAGACGALMFALMTGRSWEKSALLIGAGAVLMGGVVFAILYLHFLDRSD